MPRRNEVNIATLVIALLTVLLPGAAAQEASVVPPELLQRATVEGTVRVIVQLGTISMVPEGLLATDADVVVQRQAIASVQGIVRSALRGLPHRVVRQYQTLPLLALEVSADGLRMLEAMAGVAVRVEEDEILRAQLAQSAPLTEAPAAWNLGLDGSGTAIAVIDSGVDRTHPFLAGRVVYEACFSSAAVGSRTCPNGQTQQIGSGAAAPCTVTGCEHGTHVAGIAAGNGGPAGQPYSGVARGAAIIAMQAGSRIASTAFCSPRPAPCVGFFVSDVIAALEQVYLIRGAFLMAAVNLSIVGTPRNSACDGNPMKGVIDNLRSVAIATVAAAGNNGAIGIAEPACISTVVSVGATSKSDAVPLFSNTASFLSLLAPGVSITSSVPGGGFRSMDGTSMAAPHVAGAFAILRQASPAASVSELLSALQATGVPIADPGAGGLVKPRIRIAAALAALGVPTSPRSLFIRGFYQNVLARAAEPAGLAAWDAFLAGNCNAAGFAAIAVGFFDSTEFRTVRPLTLDGLVTVLYRTFLARDPEPQGLAAWADGFRQARLALAVQGFIPSPEFQGLLPNRGEAGAVAAVITRLYVEILGRQPEPQGLAAWVSYVVASRDLEGAAVGFLVSAEFERRPLTFRDYVAVLYRAFLGRAPAPSEIDAWEPLLRTYLLQVIEAGFIPSAEFQGKIPEVCG